MEVGGGGARAAEVVAVAVEVEVEVEVEEAEAGVEEAETERADAVTFTITVAWDVPPAPEQARLKRVLDKRLPVLYEPEVPTGRPLREQAVVLVPDQLRVEELPKGIEVGEAEKETEGAGAELPPPEGVTTALNAIISPIQTVFGPLIAATPSAKVEDWILYQSDA